MRPRSPLRTRTSNPSNPMKDPQAVLNTYVTDMAAVETHIQEAVERQLNTDDINDYPEARRVLQQLHDTLGRHVTALEGVIDQTKGGNVKEAVKEAIGNVLGFAAGMYNKVRTDKASRAVRDTYTATSLAAISYHMLHTTALGLKDQRVANMAVSHLKDLAPLLVELSKVVCHVVAKELAAEDKIFDGTVGNQAVQNTQEAWSPSNVSA
jgi:hypothetical protein